MSDYYLQLAEQEHMSDNESDMVSGVASGSFEPSGVSQTRFASRSRTMCQSSRPLVMAAMLSCRLPGNYPELPGNR